ncbi:MULTISPECIES: GNAT family N-acetyltransferase [Nonomuraea]|uniref:GNAT family N-acetyltransferase n=1 Tax=Nonomuraea mangrovi TaxID=2316207 RepID=A0ABW4TB70_9ACTN
MTVAPDAQGQGIGTRLLGALERRAPVGVERFTLFTGHLSTANIRLYQRLGYIEERHETLKPGVDLVHMTKAA